MFVPGAFRDQRSSEHRGQSGAVHSHVCPHLSRRWVPSQEDTFSFGAPFQCLISDLPLSPHHKADEEESLNVKFPVFISSLTTRNRIKTKKSSASLPLKPSLVTSSQTPGPEHQLPESRFGQRRLQSKVKYPELSVLS